MLYGSTLDFMVILTLIRTTAYAMSGSVWDFGIVMSLKMTYIGKNIALV
jgi:hypothetical protein